MSDEQNHIILTSKATTKEITLYIIIAILGCLLAVLIVKDLSLTQGKVSYNPTAKQQVEFDPLKMGYLKSSPLFTHQTATIQGIVTKVSPEELTLLSKNISESFKLSPTFQVYKYQTGSTMPKVTKADLASVDLNTEAVFSLAVKGGEYYVVTISYLAKRN